jgi:hypothetical protein
MKLMIAESPKMAVDLQTFEPTYQPSERGD